MKDLSWGEMTESEAAEICSWRYDPPFDVYNTENDDESRESFLEGLHFGVRDLTSNLLVGYFALGPAATLPLPELSAIYQNEAYTDIALGVRPDLRGKGYGTEIFRMAMTCADMLFPGDGYRVTVAMDNPPALSLYKRLGFEEICSFQAEIIFPNANGKICTAEKEMCVMVKIIGAGD